MKQLILLTCLSFFPFFTKAQDTLLTKLITRIDSEYVSISNPIYINNTIVFFTSLYDDSLSFGDLKMITLDTSGNVIQKKNITINGHYGIALKGTKNTILNSEGNFVIVGEQLTSKGFYPCVLEITPNGKLLMQNYNAPKDMINAEKITEYKDKYLIEGLMYYKSNDPDPLCGVNPPVIGTYILKKDGKLLSYFYRNMDFFIEDTDSTIIIIDGTSKYQLNLKTTNADFIYKIPKSDKYFYVENGIRLNDKEFFATGFIYDTLIKRADRYYGVFYIEDLKPKWYKTVLIQSLVEQYDYFDIQQNVFNKNILICKTNNFSISEERKIRLQYIDNQLNIIWSRNDTLAHRGITNSTLQKIKDYYMPFYFLPSGNMCTLILSSTSQSIEK